MHVQTVIVRGRFDLMLVPGFDGSNHDASEACSLLLMCHWHACDA